MELLNWTLTTLRNQPELIVFLTLGLGYWVGNIKIGTFSLGTVTGVLIVGVLIGQFNFEISSNVKAIFFIMFLFAIGYGVGPQFVRGLGSDGLPQVLFSILISFIILLFSFIAAKFAGFDLGFSAGMFAGSQTISAAIGLSTDAINNLGLSAEKSEKFLNELPVAYAVTYFFGTLGTGWILSKIGPILLGIDLKKECKKYEKIMSGNMQDGEIHSAWHEILLRAYRIEADSKLSGCSVLKAETGFSKSRIFIERIRRDKKIINTTLETLLLPGDEVVISGHYKELIQVVEKLAVEIDDQKLLSIPVESADIVITSKAVHGETLHDLSKEDFARGVYLTKITRGADGVNVPLFAKTTLHRGDILRVTGSSRHLDRITEILGYIDRPSALTDMVFVGLAIFIGGIIGSITVPISGIPITISSSGGALIAGLITGWLRSVHPTFGRIPAPSLWFMNSVGLNMFIAVVGISSGPSFIAGLKEAGWGLFFWGAFATAIPMLLAPLIGKYIFKFHPAINLGCCAGTRTSTPSVGMVKDAADSDIPMLGYTIPYAINNTLLTIWGLVIVFLLK